MKDMFGMMKKVQEMQSKLGAVQAELDEMEVSGQSGGGLVHQQHLGSAHQQAGE